jgi:lysozyme
VNLDALKASVRAHEGLRLKPYLCTAQKRSIGYGRNLDDTGISEAEAEIMLENDIQTAIAELGRAFPSYTMHSDNRQAVLAEMCLNMGAPRLAGFKRMWAALAKTDYDTAAREMLLSGWSVQTGKRAATLAERMRNGA